MAGLTDPGASTVTVHVDASAAEVVLNRPAALNALTQIDLVELRRIFTALADRPELRAVLIRGEGRAFCAGRDVVEVDPTSDDAYAVLDGLVHPMLRAIRSIPVPVVAAVQGACLGIGLGIAASCDVVYLARTARIGSPFARLGAVLDSGGHALLVDRLGPYRAMDLILSGELLDGEAAVAAGLGSRVFDADEVLPAARRLMDTLTNGPTATFTASKRIIAGLLERRGYLDLEPEARAQATVSNTADFVEGFTAFQQKRPPTFAGH